MMANDINNVIDIDIDMISILSKTFDTAMSLIILFNTSSIIKLKLDHRFH